MKICLIGGIYGLRGEASAYLRLTPETTLEAGLRNAGHEVTTLSHYCGADFGRFDVVHVHHLSYGAARLASDPSPVPFVFTPHDASEMSGMRLSIERAFALKYVLSRADRIVSLSAAEARFQQQRHGIEAGRIATIPNGINANRFSFEPRRSRNSSGKGRPWRLLFAGQLIELKGCDLILRAVASLDEDIELTLAYQSATLEAELESLAKALGILGRVHFVGKLEPGRLAELYRKSDLLVLASRTEALPSVITEAMLTGLPFVSTDVGGIREQAAGFGHLLPRRSAEDLAAGIRHVLIHYDRFAESASSMSRYARSTYSIQAMVECHEALYQGLLGERPRRFAWRRAALNPVVRAAVERWGSRSGSPASETAATIPNQSTAEERL